MRRLTFAIVGCGNFTANSLAGMLASDQWRLVGIMDPDKERLEAARQASGLEPGQAHLDEASLYKAVRPDVVFVHSPLAQHYDNCVRAIDAGCNVCCQKPFVLELTDGVDLVRRAGRAGRWISVGQTARLSAAMMLIGQKIDEGAIGTPRFGHRTSYRDRMRSLRESQLTEPWPVINACAVHHFDLFRAWFGGRISRAMFRAIACEWNPYWDPGVVTGWLELESGVVMTYLESFVSRITLGPACHPLEDAMIQGSEGALHWTGPWGHGPVELMLADAAKPVVVHAGGDDWPKPMTLLMEKLAATVRGEAPAFCPAADNLWSLVAICAARQSASEGGRVIDVIELGRRAGLESKEPDERT